MITPYKEMDLRARFVAGDASLKLLQVNFGLRRYRADHGDYPKSLATLTPTYVPAAVTSDPFSGATPAPFRYRRSRDGKSFTLYSLGPNLKDDGGTPGRWPKYEMGDIVSGRRWQAPKGPSGNTGAMMSQ